MARKVHPESEGGSTTYHTDMALLKCFFDQLSISDVEPTVMKRNARSNAGLEQIISLEETVSERSLLRRSLSCNASVNAGEGQKRSRMPREPHQFAKDFAVEIAELRVQQKTIIGFLCEYFVMTSGSLGMLENNVNFQTG